jgi:predicted O-linked N-acetylglucosamine transferase (SPINDLY family)
MSIPDPTQNRLLLTAFEHHQAGRLAQAEPLYRQLLALNPHHPEALHFLGLLAAQVGRRDIALDLLRRAIAARPDYADAYSNLGNVLKDEGRLPEALAAQRQAVALDPTRAEAHYNLGVALAASGHVDEAIAAYRQALALKPHSAETHFNLGVAFAGRDQFDEAAAAYRQALALRPDLPEPYNNLGNALKDLGQLDDALATFRQALAVNPNLMVAHHNLLYALHFHPAYDAAAITAELRRWHDRFAAPLQQSIQPHANTRDPQRQLRIGYVSPDFYSQAESFFTIPLLEHHDHSQFEIHCYSSARKTDELTNRIRAAANHWHDVRRDSDEALARRIRADRIDILVDLTMHMADNRALLFARKPAPVQICWLAYPGSTGMAAMDYRLTDPHLDSPDADTAGFPEQPLRLPDSWVVYDPLCDIPPRPAEQSGPLTFGSFNMQVKFNDPLLQLWARLLQNIPQSRLVLMIRTPAFRRHILDIMQSAGIAPNRLSFIHPMFRPNYLRAYDQIDIALDPLPYNGITTTCDALYMGVPVLTLVGQTACGRAGKSILSCLDLHHWITHTPEEFLQRAADIAANIPALVQLRSTLRQRMQQSPLMDAPRFARHVESAYRQAWHTWCASTPTPYTHSH